MTAGRLLYSLIMLVLAPVLVVRLLLLSLRQPEYRQHLRQRLGVWPQVPKQGIWIHCVSVGESMAAKPLIQAVLRHCAHCPLIVTSTTPTGRAAVQQHWGDQVVQRWLPWDLPGVASWLMRRYRPRLVIIFETELWPNWLNACQRWQAPVLLANARLSERSCQGYRRYAWLLGNSLSAITQVAAQTALDAQRFAAIGIDARRIAICGATKFDVTLSPQALHLGRLLRQQCSARPVWLFASSHAGEESLALAVHRQVQMRHPLALLLLAVRHPHRATEVVQLLQQQGMSYQLRSQRSRIEATTEVLLIDTLGELQGLYGATDVAVMGGSFVKVGGHNPLEPARLAKPVIIGPYHFKLQALVAQMQQAGALICVDDQQQLAEQLLALLDSPPRLAQQGQLALRYVQQHQGAVAWHLQWIKQAIAAPRAPYD